MVILTAQPPIPLLYSITCNLCSKLYIGESGHKLSDCFRKLDVKNKGSDLSKPVARHFDPPQTH